MWLPAAVSPGAQCCVSSVIPRCVAFSLRPPATAIQPWVPVSVVCVIEHAFNDGQRPRRRGATKNKRFFSSKGIVLIDLCQFREGTVQTHR